MKISHKIATVIITSLVFLACKKNTDQANITENNAEEFAMQQQRLKLDLNDTDLTLVKKTDAEWKKVLNPNQYFILREQGTEPPFNNEYHDNHETGNYFCAGCGLPLFNSKTKFESGTGWPSFYAPIAKSRVDEAVDNSLGMVRGEIVCARCKGHLGHVFSDGPKPTGLRYCMDSGALIFQKSK